MRLLLVRHGETAWNAARKLQGQADISLSERGARQVAGLQGIVRAFAPIHTVASDLRRTLESAAALGYTPERDPRWREADLGAWTGESIDALRERTPEAYRAWREGTLTPAGAEAFETLSARVLGATCELLGRGETTLVVTHGGPIRAVCAHWLGLPPKRVIPVSPGSLTVLEFAANGAVPSAKLHTFNWTPYGPLLDPPD